MSDLIQVRFFFQRHGKHIKDMLTEEGILQVTSGAQRHLRGITFDYVLASEKQRGLQTATQALAAIGHESVDNIRQDPNWGFAYAEEATFAKEHPWPEVLKLVQAERRAGRLTSVAFMLKHWPIGNIVRQVLRCAMKLTAERIAATPSGKPVMNVLVGAHGSNMLAAVDIDRTEGCLNFGDLAYYTWVFEDQGTAVLATSQYLSSGITEF